MEPQPHEATSAKSPANPLNVLIADDEPDCRDIMEIAVRALGHSCRSARDGIEAWEMHEEEPADVILSDWRMPRMDGLELCRRVRHEAPSSSYTHFIFVTGNDDKAHFVHGMREGADDYIAKPVDLDELEARLTAAGRVVKLHRDLQGLNASLRHDSERAMEAARTDPLTLAFNRRALAEDLQTLVARASRYGHRYCAALCDVDEFKAYNDHFGHVPGDGVLRRIAAAMHRGLRRGDVLYRYGGEEFLAILPEQSLAEAATGMDRVRQEVERLAIPHAPGAGSSFVTISVGIADRGVDLDGSMDDWLRRADAALYVAKGRGRNCVVVGGDS